VADDGRDARSALLRAWRRVCEAIELWATNVMAVQSKGYTSSMAMALMFHAVAHVFFWTTVQSMDLWTDDWLQERHPSSQRLSKCVGEVTVSMCQRIRELELVSTSRLRHHYEISRSLQSYQFGFLSTAFWSSTMLAMGAVTVLRKGFDDVTPGGRGFIMGALLSSAFFGGFPSLVSLDENIHANLDSYNAYDGIQNELRTYASTGQSVTGNHVDGASFLHKVDLMLADLPAPRIEFDTEQLDAGKSRFFQLSQELESMPGVAEPSESAVGGVEIPEEDPIEALYRSHLQREGVEE